MEFETLSERLQKFFSRDVSTRNFLRENRALDKMREGARKSSRYDEVAM